MNNQEEKNNLERESLIEIISSPRKIGAMETLLGVGVGMCGLIPELEEARIPFYIGATYLIADGVADIISNRYDFLWQETKQLIYRTIDKIEEYKMRKEMLKEKYSKEDKEEKK